MQLISRRTGSLHMKTLLKRLSKTAMWHNLLDQVDHLKWRTFPAWETGNDTAANEMLAGISRSSLQGRVSKMRTRRSHIENTEVAYPLKELGCCAAPGHGHRGWKDRHAWLLFKNNSATDKDAQTITLPYDYFTSLEKYTPSMICR